MDLPIDVLIDREADGIEGMLYFAELTKELYNDSDREADGIEGSIPSIPFFFNTIHSFAENNDIEELGSMLGIVFKIMTDEETMNTNSNYFDIEQETDITGNSNVIPTYETAVKSDFEKNIRSLMETELDAILNHDAFEMNIETDDGNGDELLNIFNNAIEDIEKGKETNETNGHRPLCKLKRNDIKGNSKFLQLKKVVKKLRSRLVQEKNKNVEIEYKLTEAENNAATSLGELTLARERETALSICVTQKIDEIEQSTESMKLILEQFHELQQREATHAKIIELNMKEMDDTKRECELYRSNSERMEKEASNFKQKLIEVETKTNRATDKWKQKLFEAERRERSARETLQVMTQKEQQMSLLASKAQREADQSNELVDSLIAQLEAANKNNMSCLDLVESELECSICSELFVCPTTLNCSHTFCEYCLNEWRRSGTLNKCPICRKSITYGQKCLVLESYINKLVQNLPEDAKKKRQDMIKQRE